jgi:hypothetical protein
MYALSGWAAQDSVLKLYSMLSEADCTDTAAEAISAEVCCTTPADAVPRRHLPVKKATKCRWFRSEAAAAAASLP